MKQSEEPADPPAGAARSDSPRVDSTLSKGLLILENLSASAGAKGVTELARELGMTKSNVFRLLQKLSALGYVKQTEGKHYSATLRTWQMHLQVMARLNLREIAAPEMRELWQQTREVIYLAVVENRSVIYIDKIEGPESVRSWNPIGGMAPVHCVANGKSILAANYEAMRGSMVGNLTRYTDRTLTNMKALDADVAATLERGYAFDRGEFREHVCGCGAPIFLPGDKAIASIGVSVLESHLSKGSVEKLGALVREAAARITERLANS